MGKIVHPDDFNKIKDMGECIKTGKDYESEITSQRRQILMAPY
jgi:hypothetical protein